MSTNWHNDQKAMMRAFGQTTDKIDLGQANLYLSLILEELREMLLAANPIAVHSINDSIQGLQAVAHVAYNCDSVELLDGIVDILVVTLGLGVSLNFDMAQAWDAVHASNMAKVDQETGSVRRRPDGKVLKPAGWKPPTETLRRLVFEAGHPVKV